MILPNRVSALSGISSIKTTNYYSTANPGGPTGSSLFTVMIVVTFKRIPTTSTELFQRYTAGGGADGWTVNTGVGTLAVFVANATPAYVISPNLTITASMVGTPLIIIGRYNNGTIQCWSGGVSFGTTTLGAGFTSTAAATRIGVSSGATTPAIDAIIHECFFMDSYDVQASYNSATFGTGATGWNAQITEDLQQGRYVTNPQGNVVGLSDVYWSARNACLGVGGTALTWADRYNGVVMTRVGAPQSASVAGRWA